jgi:hypothetical protein
MTRAALVFAILVGSATLAHARDRDDALDLARCIVAEAGRQPGADAPAILHVLQRRASLPAWRGRGAADVARAYCVALSGRSTTDRARRLRTATRDELPARVVSLADAWVAGERPADPCGGQAWDWDGREHAGRVVVDCGATSNVFFGRAGR